MKLAKVLSNTLAIPLNHSMTIKRKLDLTNGYSDIDTCSLSLVPNKKPKAHSIDALPIVSETSNLLKVPRFWLAIDFITATTPEGRSSSTISQISLALGQVVLRKCIGRWTLNIMHSAPMESTSGITNTASPLHLNSNVASPGKMKTYDLCDALAVIISSVESLCNDALKPYGATLEMDDIILITDGHVGLRNSLHRDMVQCNIPKSLAGYPLWWTYLEVGQMATEIHQSATTIVGLDQALSAMNLPPISHQSALSVVDGLNSVVEEYLAQGYSLRNTQKISPEYTPMVIPEGFDVAPGTVVEVSKLPWMATPYTIASFFRGLNIHPGGIAIKIVDGRRSNTAYICFDSPLDAQLACVRDQIELFPFWAHQLAGDYSSLSFKEGEIKHNRLNTLQVFPVTEKFFLQYAVCRLTDVANFLNQLTDEKQIVVRMRGLPYSTKKQHIMDFFNQVNATILNNTNGIYFVNYCDRRPTGDAFVIFTDDEAANKALKRHRNYLGQRYVELFKASPSEQIQICQSVNKNGSSPVGSQGKLAKPMTPHTVSQDSSIQHKFDPQLNNSKSTANIQPNLTNKFFYHHLLSQPLLGHISSLASPISTYSNSVGLQDSPEHLTPESFYRADVHGVRIDSIGGADFNDPTDPNFPFMRPLPAVRPQSVIHILGLPPPTMSHEMRFYLGPENFAKVIRMFKIVDDSWNRSWLLLLANLSDSLQVIENLIKRPFTLASGLNLPSQTINPRFILYEVNKHNHLSILPMEKLPPNIFIDRLVNIHTHSEIHSTINLQKTQSTVVPNRLVTADPFSQNMLSTSISADNPRQFVNPLKCVQSIGSQFNFMHHPIFNAADLTLTNPPIFISGQHEIDLMELTKGNNGALSTNFSPFLQEKSRLNSSLMNNPSILQVVGLPRNVSMHELVSLSGPVAHLLSEQPQFLPFQVQEDGTCTYLASFASRADADIVKTNCPLGSLRDNTYITLMSPFTPLPVFNRVSTLLPSLLPFY